ncbi:MAG TPA: hypothetical protein DCM40_32040, partial [Maribacter sp.]|nr:hypothetical protein [Maribacter sp.]
MFVSLDEINVPVKDSTVGSDMTEETVKISFLFEGLKTLSPISNNLFFEASFVAIASILAAFEPKTLNDEILDVLSVKARAFVDKPSNSLSES